MQKKLANKPISTPKLSLSAKYRLHSRKDFLRFFENAEIYRLSQCMIFRVPNGREHFRLGVTLKLKVTSVQRNRIKRIIREQFRLLGPSLSGYDYNVLISNKKMTERDQQDRLVQCIQAELLKSFKKSAK